MKRKLRNAVGLSFFSFDIHLIEAYHKHMEGHFNNELKFIEEEAIKFEAEEKESCDDEAISFRQDSFIDDRFMVKDNYRKHFRESQIIQLYSFIEDTLRQSCKIYCIRFEIGQGWDMQKGSSDIEKIKNYYKNIVGLNLATFQKEWEFIDNLRLLRNRIVHNGAWVIKDEKSNKQDKQFEKIKKFSKGKFILKSFQGSKTKFEIILDEDSFIPSIIATIKSFFDKIANHEID